MPSLRVQRVDLPEAGEQRSPAPSSASDSFNRVPAPRAARGGGANARRFTIARRLDAVGRAAVAASVAGNCHENRHVTGRNNDAKLCCTAVINLPPPPLPVCRSVYGCDQVRSTRRPSAPRERAIRSSNRNGCLGPKVGPRGRRAQFSEVNYDPCSVSLRSRNQD